MHDVARIEQPNADAAIVRRCDGRVFELGLRGLDRGCVGRNRGFGLIDLAPAVGRRSVAVSIVLERQGLRARKVFLGGDQQGFVLRLLGFGLIERGLKKPGIDLRQHVALLDMLAFGEKHLLKLAIDLGMNGTVNNACTVPSPVR